MLKIIGAIGKIRNIDKFLKKIRKFSGENNLIIQIFNADLIYGKNHLVSSVKHAKRAFNTNKNVTNSIEMEILLYASGERQIKLAISKMGVKIGNSKVAFVVLKDKGQIENITINKLMKLLGFSREDKVLEGNKDKIVNFGITEQEINTITESKYGDLILEKVAMVDVIK
jgi:KEOPS complex subunit Cgi121